MKVLNWRDCLWPNPFPLVAVVLLIDYLSGPFIQFPILFILPVGVAAWFRGMKAAFLWSVFMPLFRLLFMAHWGWPWPWQVELLNSLIRLIAFLGIALLLSRLVEHRREIRRLRGFLHICSFCKRIRGHNGQWIQMEKYISGHSEAQFSHSLCPECLRKNYPEYDDHPEEDSH
jgi:hypothetical protein